VADAGVPGSAPRDELSRSLHRGFARFEEFDRIVSTWDTANKASSLAEFSVCIHWGVSGKNLYLLDVLRRQADHPELKRAVREEPERRRPDVVLIEDKASGTEIDPGAGRRGHLRGHPCRPQGYKVMRMPLPRNGGGGRRSLGGGAPAEPGRQVPVSADPDNPTDQMRVGEFGHGAVVDHAV
jgi:hypothetical protein